MEIEKWLNIILSIIINIIIYFEKGHTEIYMLRTENDSYHQSLDKITLLLTQASSMDVAFC